MPVKIRLQRKGRRKRPFYFIVVADSRAPRDGKYIEKIGTYNPLTKPAKIELDREEALAWLEKGAQPTDTARRILSYQGVLYLKHLKRGVKLGLFDESVVKEKFDEWLSKHEGDIRKELDAQKAAEEKDRKAAEEEVRKAREELEAKKAEEEAKAKAEAEAEQKAKEEAEKAEAEQPEEAKAEEEKVEAKEEETKEEAKEEKQPEEKKQEASGEEKKEEKAEAKEEEAPKAEEKEDDKK